MLCAAYLLTFAACQTPAPAAAAATVTPKAEAIQMADATAVSSAAVPAASAPAVTPAATVAPAAAPAAVPAAAPAAVPPAPAPTVTAAPAAPPLSAPATAIGLGGFYGKRAWAPLWVAADGTETPAGKALEDGLTLTAIAEELDPRAYAVTDKGTPLAREIALDTALIHLARDLRKGAKPAPAPEAVLDSVSAATDMNAALSALAPQNPFYQKLKTAIATYRGIAAHGGWPKVAMEGKIKPGDHNPAVPAIRQRLLVTGELSPAAAVTGALQGDLYDSDLAKAVITFQTSHGLAADAIIGKPSIAALGASPKAVVDKLKINLDRTRKLADDIENGDVLVNIPGFEVFLFEAGKVALRSRIIVGTDETATPDFSATIQDVVINPPWYVPDSIATKEILPKLAEDPSYLDSQNMIVSSHGAAVDPGSVDWKAAADGGSTAYHFRQKPGKDNSLGRIKIQFPNDFDVYLHDTPKRWLFDRRVRNFSHGCMRVEKVVELASALLGSDWPVSRINDAIDKGDTKVVKVAVKRQVDVMYLTAWVDPETGVVQFRDDIYNHDVPGGAPLPQTGAQIKKTPDKNAELPKQASAG